MPPISRARSAASGTRKGTLRPARASWYSPAERVPVVAKIPTVLPGNRSRQAFAAAWIMLRKGSFVKGSSRGRK